MLITKKVQIINYKKFVKTPLNPHQKVFVIHVTALFVKLMAIYLAHKAQIALSKINKTSITILKKYLNIADIFSKEFATILPEHINIKSHAINLKKSK